MQWSNCGHSANVGFKRIVLKKWLAASVLRFSGVFLPLTGVRERFVGRFERSIFAQENGKKLRSDFFNTIRVLQTFKRQILPLPERQVVAARRPRIDDCFVQQLVRRTNSNQLQNPKTRKKLVGSIYRHMPMMLV